MLVCICVCVSGHNSGTSGAISTKLGTHIAICMCKNLMYVLYIPQGGWCGRQGIWMIHIVDEIKLLLLPGNRVVMTSRLATVGQTYPRKHIHTLTQSHTHTHTHTYTLTNSHTHTQTRQTHWPFPCHCLGLPRWKLLNGSRNG
jgi:hypothetical protein